MSAGVVMPEVVTPASNVRCEGVDYPVTELISNPAECVEAASILYQSHHCRSHLWLEVRRCIPTESDGVKTAINLPFN